jgi:methyltransferase (TIGR00027 family)
MAILQGLPIAAAMTFGVGIRSRFLDGLLREVLAEGEADTVLILGAGLDTRPWRLDLPPGLRWIEVDFPDMLDYKYARLTETPHCQLERMAADLTSEAAREEIFARAGKRAVLITEGLLMYLPGQTVEAIADAAAHAGVRRWFMDLATPEFARRVGMSGLQSIQNVRAADCLDGRQIWDMLHARGWSSFRQRTYSRDVAAAAPERIQAMVQARMAAGGPPPEPPDPNDQSGVHVFAR